MSLRAELRVCASCEWIFRRPAETGCPKCGWAHYGARYVYGNAAYRFAKTQEPWFKRAMSKHAEKLRLEIKAQVSQAA